jgi:hypothetical protein
MSNKTQLQTNNTALDALITRVNAAKDTAASLPEAGSGGGIQTCTVTFNSTNSSYTKIPFIQYTTLDSDGKVIGKTLLSSDITSGTFSIQCVCNTCIAGLFPPTKSSGVSHTSNFKENLSANSSNGAFIWATLTALPGETVTITFS